MRSTDIEPRDERRVEELLTATLHRQADTVSPSPGALSRIKSRLVSASPGARVAPRPASAWRRRRSFALASAGVALVAAMTAVAVTGVRPDPAPAPEPARSPSASSATFTAQPQSSVPKLLAVYRPGPQDGPATSVFLGREWTPVVQPFSERQALDALLNTPPVDPELGAATSGRFEIASVTETSTEIVVDLAANDTTLRPQGSQPRELAERWVQAWVYTIQDAYSSQLPVRITLRGAPTTLFGYLDTSQPIRRAKGLRIVSMTGIFSPRDGSSVTSPVNLSALAPEGVAGWTVYEATSGKQVFAEQEDTRGHESPGTFSPDLPAGRYRGVYQRVAEPSAAPAFRRTVTFTVSGPAPWSITRPVTNPETTPVAVTPLYRPSRTGKGLIPQWVARPAEPSELVRELLDSLLVDLAAKSRPASPARVASVTSSGGRTVVDLSELAPTADVSERTSALRAQALVCTLSDYYGAPQQVLLTLNGRPLALFGDRDPQRAITRVGTPVERRLDVSTSGSAGPGGPSATIIGGLAAATSEVVYFISPQGSDQVLYQGTVPGITGHSLGFGFALALPPGSYRLEVGAKASPASSTVITDLNVPL